MIRLTLSEKDVTAVEDAFSDASPNEAGAFFLIRGEPSPLGLRLVASEPYFPGDNEWDHVGPHNLQPSARLLSAMISRSHAKSAGLLFVHSHPDSRHPTSFSDVDDSALRSLAEVIPALLDGPFAAAVWGPNGWSARAFQQGMWTIVERITSSGSGLRILESSDRQVLDQLDDRQSRALGTMNGHLRALDVAVVGCGGLGSPLVETLVRMGVRRVVLVDHDLIDDPSNVRRVFGSRAEDVGTTPYPSKVSVVSRHVNSLGLDTEISDICGDIRHPEVFANLLDVDVVMCATDSHSSRAVIDAAAYAFHLPVIDCGVRVGQKRDGGLAGLVSEIRISAPGLPCLWCRGTLSADLIRAENLPVDDRAALEKEGYVVGVAGVEPSVTALTVMGAGMMASALLGLMSGVSRSLPSSYILDGMLGDAIDTSKAANINPACICGTRLSQGYNADLGLAPVTADASSYVINSGLESALSGSGG